jgi:DNA ligase-1
LPLHRIVEERILPLAELPVEAQRLLITHTWRELDAAERLVWHKLIMGEFRVGVAGTLVARALANVAGVPPEIMSHRLMGAWAPTTSDYDQLLKPSSAVTDPGQPYPFFLAHPLAVDLKELGDPGQWQAEWKWDGIRAQLLRRQDQIVLWSRGEDLLTDRFPEIAAVGAALPNGVVLDGEILAWRDEQPLPFAALQTRIGRKKLSAKVLADAPAAFMAYDLLELEGVDLRASSLVERRAKLEALSARLPSGIAARVSPAFEFSSWDEVVELRQDARQRGVEGVMLKRRASAYGVGRPKGDWWKWKVDPFSIDAVLIYAQPGHGRRASLHTDYTFGVWDAGDLVPVAKAYSGLTDAEIREVDAFVRKNTLDRHGPLRIVRPQLVFELHFEGIQASIRHRSGLAVRFPRMNRWRRDKKPDEADTLETLRALMKIGRQ